MAQQPLINGESGLDARTKINANDAELYSDSGQNANDITALENRFDKQTINLVANTDYNITNPFVFPIVPNIIQVRASDGTLIIDAYNNIDQSDGDIIINTGASYTGAIITIIGW